MLSSGHFRIGRYRGAPLRMHWTLPVMMLLFGRLEVVPFAWLAMLALILVHEAGHAALIRQYGLRVLQVDLHGFGGECRWVGSPTRREQVSIAWGGVIAQLTAFVVVQALVLALGEPSSGWLVQIVDVYTRVNLWMVAVNLLPLPGLDGELAWQILPFYRRRAKVTDRRVIRVPRLHVVQRHRPVVGEERDQVLSEIDREIAEITRSHNDQAMADEERDRSQRDLD